MTQSSKIKTLVLSLLASIVLVPVTAAVLDNAADAEARGPAAELTAEAPMRTGSTTVERAPRVVQVAEVTVVGRAVRAVRPASRIATSSGVFCTVRTLEQGGSPDHRTVRDCTGDPDLW